METEYKPSDFAAAMRDPRVTRALEYALRDRSICGEFDRLRGQVGAQDAIYILSGRFFLSEEHIRTIVYRKRGVPEE